MTDVSFAKALKIKRRELATLEKRVEAERSRIEHELATLDQQAKERRETLENEISALRKAASS